MPSTRALATQPGRSLRQNLSSRLGILALAAVFLLGSSLRAGAVDARSIWWDEAYSWWVASQRLDFLVSWVAQKDVHPLGHYLLLHFNPLLDVSDAGLRVELLLFGVLTIAAIGYLGYLIDGRRLAVASTLFAAVSPLLIFYSDEARMYSLVSLLAATTLCALVLVERRPGRSTAVLAGLSAAGLVWADYSGVWLLIAIAGGAILRAHRFTKAQWAGFGLAAITAGLALAPAVPILASQVPTFRTLSWIPRPTVDSVASFLESLGGYGGPATPWLAFISGVFAIAMIVAAVTRRPPWLIWAGSIGALAVIVAYSLVGLTSVFTPRLTIASLPAWCVLFGAGTVALWVQAPPSARLASRALAALLLVGVTAVSLRTVAINADPASRSDWRRASAIVESEWDATDAMAYVGASSARPFGYYARRWPLSEGAVLAAFRIDPPPDDVSIRAIVCGGPRIWLVSAMDDGPGPRDRWLQALSRVGRVDAILALGEIHVDRFEGCAARP